MTGYIIGALLSALTVLILIVLVRTITFKPQKLDPVAQENIPLDKDKIVADMVDMVRCKTISNRNEALVDRAEFEKFELLLAERFPLIHKSTAHKGVPQHGYRHHNIPVPVHKEWDLTTAIFLIINQL